MHFLDVVTQTRIRSKPSRILFAVQRGFRIVRSLPHLALGCASLGAVRGRKLRKLLVNPFQVVFVDGFRRHASGVRKRILRM